MLAAITNFLIGWAVYLGVTAINFVVAMCNAAIVAFVAFITAVANLLPAGSALPTMDATPTGSVWSAMVQGLNWFFPMSFFVSCLAFVSAALVAYAVIAPLARWVKLLR